MAWTTGRTLLQLSSHRIQRQSFVSTTPDGSSGQRLGQIGTLESESGTKLNTDGFPRASKGSYMEFLFSKWLRDNSSIHGTWHRFFRDLVKDKATGSADASPSTKSDINVQPESEYPRQEEALAPQPKLGLVLPAEDPVITIPEQMTKQKTPKEPEKESKVDQKSSLRHRRRIPKFTLLNKFAKFRRQASSMKRSDKCLHRAQRIPGSKCGRKGRTKGNNTRHFKSYYEEKLNKEKAKGKENKLPEKPQEKPHEKPQENPQEMPQKMLQPIRPEVSNPNPTPKTLKFDSQVAFIQDLENSTMNMASSDPIYQQILKKTQPWNGDGTSTLYKMPSDIKSFKDLPRALIEYREKVPLQSENKVFMSEDKATESIPSDAAAAAGPQPKNLPEKKSQSPLDDGISKKPQADAPSQQSSDP